jgi:hypothetical protein
MAKAPTFNFGANAKPKKPAKSGGGKKSTKSGGKGNAWTGYVGGGGGGKPFVLPD